MEEIKKWYSNFDYQNKFNTKIINDNILLSTCFNYTKDIYMIQTKLNNVTDHYLKYFWNPEKIKDINNTIKEIEVIEEKDNYKILDCKINIETSNIDVGIFRKKEKIFLEKYSNGFYIYSKNIYTPNQIIKIKEGYTVIHIYNSNGVTKIDIVFEIVSEIPLIFKNVPALIIIKTIINLQNQIEG